MIHPRQRDEDNDSETRAEDEKFFTKRPKVKNETNPDRGVINTPRQWQGIIREAVQKRTSSYPHRHWLA